MSVKINGFEITDQMIDYEVERAINFYLTQGIPQEEINKDKEAIRQAAIEHCIATRLMLEEAERQGIKASDEHINDQLDKIAKANGGMEEFEKRVKASGASLDMVKAQIDFNYKLMTVEKNAVEMVPEATEEAARAYYDAHKNQFCEEEQVNAQHILITPKSKSDEDKKAALEEIQAIRQRIIDGAEFTKEAELYSACPSGKQNGGSLGWFGRGMMVKPFEDAAFTMKLGEVSEVIETQFGFHIIYVNDREEARQLEFEEVKAEAVNAATSIARESERSRFIEELKSKATIER